MGLAKYKQKRDFKESPEPTGGKADSQKLRFVVQKHDASHLHYDFRLEMEGVLKSWAVPKGPSTDPSIKRLAMMVEDHPYDYRTFEGIIPSGYGAGTVIVWDEGFYEPAETTSTDKKIQDRELRHQLYSGKLKIKLAGKKLKGEYALVKAKGRGENGWLLFKTNDAYASANDITLKEKSVISKKTLAQVAKTTTNFYGSGNTRQADKESSKKGLYNKKNDHKPIAGKSIVTSKAKTPPSSDNDIDTRKASVNFKKPATASGDRSKPAVEPAKARKILLNAEEETQVRKVNGHDLKFTNLNKFYWPKEKITKRDLLNYYYQVAPYILPYLKDRPQSMLRHPDGITGEAFFFKDVTGKAPDWIETFLYHSDADDRDRNYLVAKDDASLLYMVSLGCIEMNPWHSRVQKENYPDWCIIDLDPGKTNFEQVIQAALVTKEILDELNIAGYPKTSGSKGIHIYIPFGAKYTYEQSKEFARVIATLVNHRLPAFTSIERAVKDRKGKMYIDFLQNRSQATVSAPYSVRPKPGATVSMPLHWDEIRPGLKMTDFTIYNALERIRREGDIFKPVIGKGVNLSQAIDNYMKSSG